jgi:hypothetical protein
MLVAGGGRHLIPIKGRAGVVFNILYFIQKIHIEMTAAGRLFLIYLSCTAHRGSRKKHDLFFFPFLENSQPFLYFCRGDITLVVPLGRRSAGLFHCSGKCLRCEDLGLHGTRLGLHLPVRGDHRPVLRAFSERFQAPADGLIGRASQPHKMGSDGTKPAGPCMTGRRAVEIDIHALARQPADSCRIVISSVSSSIELSRSPALGMRL